MMNNTSFSGLRLPQKQRIPLRFTLNLLDVSADMHTAELVVQLSRPVYDTDYSTTLLLLRDRELNFRYVDGADLVFNMDNIENNLMATLGYYALLGMGYYFDSFSLQGGEPFFVKAKDIATRAASNSEWLGWDVGRSRENRGAVINLLTAQEHEPFRAASYTYYIKGLDRFSSDAKEGCTRVIEALKALRSYQEEEFSSPLLAFWSASKLGEIVELLAPQEDALRLEGLKLLESLAPTESDKWERLRRKQEL